MEESIGIKQFIIKYLPPNSKNRGVWLSTILLLLGFIFLKWDGTAVLFSYFFESIIVIFISLIQSLFVAKYSKERSAGLADDSIITVYSTIFVFFLVFSLFVVVQLIFVFIFFFPEFKFNNIWDQVYYLFSLDGMKEAYFIIIAANVYYAVKNFFIPKKYLRTQIATTILQPMLRVFIQQFVVILGGFLFMLFDMANLIAILLIFVRGLVDLIGAAITSSPEIKAKLVALAIKSDNTNSDEENEKTKREIEQLFD